VGKCPGEGAERLEPDLFGTFGRGQRRRRAIAAGRNGSM